MVRIETCVSHLPMLNSYNRERYVCVEPGYVAEFKSIQPGETWIGGQTLTPIKASSLL